MPVAAAPAAFATPAAAERSTEQRLSAFCAAGCGALAFAIPLAVAAFWAFGSWPLLALVRLLPPDVLGDMNPTVLLWQRVAGGLICLVPAAILGWGLLRARHVLDAFVRSDFFAPDAVSGLRDYAGAMFWAAVTGFLSVPVLAVVITRANAPGHHELSIDLSGWQVLSVLSGAILWVIASAMARAAAIARENAQFV